MTHILVSKLTIIGPRQAIIWTSAGILLIRTLGSIFSEIVSEIHAFSFKKNAFENVVWKLRPFCLGLNVYIMHLVRSKDMSLPPKLLRNCS